MAISLKKLVKYPIEVSVDTRYYRDSIPSITIKCCFSGASAELRQPGPARSLLVSALTLRCPWYERPLDDTHVSSASHSPEISLRKGPSRKVSFVLQVWVRVGVVGDGWRPLGRRLAPEGIPEAERLKSAQVESVRKRQSRRPWESHPRRTYLKYIDALHRRRSYEKATCLQRKRSVQVTYYKPIWFSCQKKPSQLKIDFSDLYNNGSNVFYWLRINRFVPRGSLKK